jgi:tripartite-type tricarboxylate transporter receptor subunit TctC
MGQLVVVDNRPGAKQHHGFQALAKATPDGYTFGYATFPFITNPIMYSTLPYDAASDFHPVAWATSSYYLMTVTPRLPVQSVGRVDRVRTRESGQALLTAAPARLQVIHLL